MHIFEKADQAAWIAALLITYDDYMSKIKWGEINTDDLYFKQSIVLKKANDMCTKEIENARISYHLDSGNDKASHNYFVKRKSDSFVRLVYNGEINGIKERPEGLNMDLKFNTVNGEKSLNELVNFIDNDYTKLMKNIEEVEKLNKKDYLSILEFLMEHSNERYTRLDKIEDDMEKERCEKLIKSAQEAIRKFKNIGDVFSDFGFTYDGNSSTWLDGSKTRVRSYFWIELKKKDKSKLSTSISIFAEILGDPRFRVSLEIKDSKSEENEYIRHFRYLDKIDVDKTDFEYFGPRQDNLKFDELSKEDIRAWVEDVKYRRKTKLQIGKTLNYDSLLDMNEEDIFGFFEENVMKLEKYYDIAVGDIEDIMDNSSHRLNENIKVLSKNQILYGPPGTGKTYNAIYRALEVIDREKYNDLINNPVKRAEAVKVFNQLLDDGQISFCTFHQSYSYEDFVEGLRSNESGNGFVPKAGIFKKICERASNKSKARRSKYNFDKNKINFFKMSLGEKNVEDDIYKYCIDNNCVALGWGAENDYTNCQTEEEIKRKFLETNTIDSENKFEIDAIRRFKIGMKADDIVVVSDGNKLAKAIGRVIGEYRYEAESEIRFKHFRNVEWLYVGDSIDVSKILVNKQFSQQSIYMIGKNDINMSGVLSLISNNLIEQAESDKYVLIIDEINRGNISKIFGELITLIEEDKRLGEKNELKITLPYSNEKFGVPNNLYILGTMNTADRSIALLDTALRRRFEFFEYMPNISLLSEYVEGINVRAFLKMINDRIEYLFDREHTIGHAYFIREDLDFNKLVSIMRNKVIPLIQEYFYGDWERTMLVLGGAGKVGDTNYFISKEKNDTKKLFKNMRVDEYQELYNYSIVEKPSKQAFLNVYEDKEE
ncbi:AAA family ATPase [Clostridium sp. C8-1-8]|uniref:AAA family ATPase n=1 Tax=Clostridium sp. C8-1-8 TaxID=2698831 RepID=UPI001FAE18F7|nr:AAA family ATPase [Clostridium sp. C8-1-8]